ncbi:MAG: hypothetical protein CL858_03720 [Cupriavidus sp.]|nr:hypothetical protein [Cupriavidus sp.]
MTQGQPPDSQSADLLSAVGCRLSAVGCRLSAVGCWMSVVGCRLSAVSGAADQRAPSSSSILATSCLSSGLTMLL